MTDILWVAGRYQLGNDPGLFQDAAYVGQELALPFRKTWVDTAAASVSIFISTTDVETWGTWDGHKVFINTTEIGRLKDPNDQDGPVERFELSMTPAAFDAALQGRDEFVLRIVLETQIASPGMSDDFVVTRIGSPGSIAAKLGWK
ncbi:MAG: hypothetical protein V4472_13055 [Pseudomonadota bacterium]